MQQFFLNKLPLHQMSGGWTHPKVFQKNFNMQNPLLWVFWTQMIQRNPLLLNIWFRRWFLIIFLREIFFLNKSKIATLHLKYKKHCFGTIVFLLFFISFFSKIIQTTISRLIHIRCNRCCVFSSTDHETLRVALIVLRTRMRSMSAVVVKATHCCIYEWISNWAHVRWQK